ncbi:PepSY domain-containing protein [Aquibacillus koreensis]|uniref:PepSY domain-containing protein n=1 Tax=Aquibacillus koreensis TaxID=279446 RepID=A0A9X3WGH5_9BACI|nr:PepSY domain-containing protein [Aquibacillus koreensis]MCT2535028.1 PepSY domain-containing protein [Aquibacillus koreensis]MDC3419315.1 PepSY domain-containing protein [Aquibacillus koreensis]
MDWKKITIAAGVGALAGYIISDQITRRQHVSPEKALKIAKEAFKQQGPVSGSWIYMKPEQLVKNGLDYSVYRGGVTRTVDGVNTQYEFYVDAATGTIIDVAATEASS